MGANNEAIQIYRGASLKADRKGRDFEVVESRNKIGIEDEPKFAEHSSERTL